MALPPGSTKDILDLIDDLRKDVNALQTFLGQFVNKDSYIAGGLNTAHYTGSVTNSDIKTITHNMVNYDGSPLTPEVIHLTDIGLSDTTKVIDYGPTVFRVQAIRPGTSPPDVNATFFWLALAKRN